MGADGEHAEAFKNYTNVEMAACVILDIHLKDGSGIELRRGLNDAGISVPVIFMTGNEDPAVRRATVASGCIAFLTKPSRRNRSLSRSRKHRRRAHRLA